MAEPLSPTAKKLKAARSPEGGMVSHMTNFPERFSLDERFESVIFGCVAVSIYIHFV